MQDIQKTISYKDNLQAFYARRCDTLNTLLLESSSHEIHKSKLTLLGISCAVKVICRGSHVTVLSLSKNGDALLARVLKNAPQQGLEQYTYSESDHKIEFEFRNDFRGLDERQRLQRRGQFHCLKLINQELGEFKDILFAGVISFDYINNFEHVHDFGQGHNDFADYVFYVFDIVITLNNKERTARIDGYVFGDDRDHLKEKIEEIAAEYEKCTDAFECSNDDVLELEYRTQTSDEEFCRIVERVKEHIRDGDAFQIVPSRTFEIECRDPQRSFAYLKKDNASPYMFYLHDTEFTMFGASPEFALRVDMPNRMVYISPIAGTKKRGTDDQGRLDRDLDSRIELELRTDSKEIAEHMMLVDLARNDLARISKPATVRVENMLHIDKYQSVQHMVSDVIGRIDDCFDAFHAYLACMNMGTLSGAPKIMAHKIIYQFEGRKRGAYGGTVCKLLPDGSLDSCIVIRTAVVKNDTAYVQAGCGVVAYSDPLSEALETKQKARSVLHAIAKANLEG